MSGMFSCEDFIINIFQWVVKYFGVGTIINEIQY